jgi:hypothetical protein
LALHALLCPRRFARGLAIRIGLVALGLTPIAFRHLRFLRQSGRRSASPSKSKQCLSHRDHSYSRPQMHGRP